jgi:hypothetical protein
MDDLYEKLRKNSGMIDFIRQEASVKGFIPTPV